MKNFFGILSLVTAVVLAFSSPVRAYEFSQSASQGKQSFPSGPQLDMTPGGLCNHPDSYRYPEHIPYCSRNVDSDVKRMIIRQYDQQYGYTIESMPRQDFKIDHFIPLCAGGSNEVENLWPQHKSIYAITDPIEPLLCQRMAEGKLKQRDAVDMVRQGKEDLSKVPGILARLNAM